VNADAVRKAVADSVPPSFRELNLKAFEKGFEYGSTAQEVTPADIEETMYAKE
jgi:Pyruvate/2-oxoacid:ferredoxin oxidoreductase gamma subunit